MESDVSHPRVEPLTAAEWRSAILSTLEEHLEVFHELDA
jgi:hypothetical protein